MDALPEHASAPPAIEFADYLDAKYPLDERSLNVEVRQACLERMRAPRPHLRWLDVGTGTAAMVRRLLGGGTCASLSITALDRDRSLLDIARAKLAAELEHSGYHTLAGSRDVEATRPHHHVSIRFSCSSLFEFEPSELARFDLITAHALMDVVPIEAALTRFRGWLEPRGMLYMTLTYDGATALFPAYGDESFENDLLREYDASMERRRVQGEVTGGAHAGRRLLSALSPTGFDTIAYGSSDWNVTPLEGRYRDRDGDVLRAMLAFMRSEGEREPAIDPASLAQWYAQRGAQIERSELGMIVHQLDMLAVPREGFTAFT